MGNELRARGQESQIRLTQDGDLLRTITAIENLTFTLKIDVISKGYLGEANERKDESYKGVSVEFSFDIESAEGILLLKALRERNLKRVNPSVQINLTFVVNLPNQQRPRITVPDLKFSSPSIRITGRDAYISQNLTAEAEDFNVIGV